MKNQFELGKPAIHLGESVANGDVELPAWASSARQFTETQRIALDSRPASATIGQWIDFFFFGVHRNCFEKEASIPSDVEHPSG
jgi:hypothetical protein